MNRRSGRPGALLVLGVVSVAAACGGTTGSAPPAHPRHVSTALAPQTTTASPTESTGGPSAPTGAWTGATLEITPTSLGAVALGMSWDQAQRGAGTALVAYGDGFSGPASGLHGTPPGTTGLEALSSSAGGGTVSCLTAIGAGGTTPAVTTPEGVGIGDTVQQLTATYGGSLHSYPASTGGGYSPAPGYVATTPRGTLSFWTTGGVVVQIATGSGASSGNRYC
jgi:hypothetical protein